MCHFHYYISVHSTGDDDKMIIIINMKPRNKFLLLEDNHFTKITRFYKEVRCEKTAFTIFSFKKKLEQHSKRSNIATCTFYTDDNNHHQLVHQYYPFIYSDPTNSHKRGENHSKACYFSKKRNAFPLESKEMKKNA